MNKDAYRGFWIAVGVLYLLVAGLLFVFPATSTPRSIQIFEAVGGAFVGVLLIVWGTSVPA